MTDERSTARLVLADGCRNPSYRVLAPRNPWRDSGNRLINNFDFRVFMFQDMVSGDSIMITANVVACVEEINCAPVRNYSMKSRPSSPRSPFSPRRLVAEKTRIMATDGGRGA